jgi:citrate lyase subunit beta/citryl-CoA lyase/(S)-citramalyl-CoA lyase
MLDTPRSMLFVSGEKPERFEKALAAGADMVCIDLEDAVHPARKNDARAAVFDFAARRAHAPQQGQGPQLAVRLNGLRTREGLADVAALIACGARFDAVLLPKVEFAEDLSMFHAWAADTFDALVALVETPLGIEQAAAMAAAVHRGAPKLSALMLGGADLAAELGADFGWDGLLGARGRLVNAARSAGLAAWDVPHLDLDDLAALAAETAAVARMGFGCKTAIHPRQIETIHAAFAPQPAELQWAHALLESHAAREASPDAAGAFMFGGKMVDAPVLRKARRIAGLVQPDSPAPFLPAADSASASRLQSAPIPT